MISTVMQNSLQAIFRNFADVCKQYHLEDRGNFYTRKCAMCTTFYLPGLRAAGLKFWRSSACRGPLSPSWLSFTVSFPLDSGFSALSESEGPRIPFPPASCSPSRSQSGGLPSVQMAFDCSARGKRSCSGLSGLSSHKQTQTRS